MTTDTDLVREKNLLANTSYLNEGKIKFLHITQNTIRQTCCQKHEKRYYKCARIHKT